MSSDKKKKLSNRFKNSKPLLSKKVNSFEEAYPSIADLTCEVVEKDMHGNVQLSGTGALGDLLVKEVKDQLGIGRVRSDTFVYLQRSFLGCVSDVDQHEAREVGEKAAQFAIWDNVDGSIVIKRTGDYSVDYELVPLERVAGKTKHMADEFINAEANGVTPAFLEYVRPLVGSNLPVPHRIRAPRVEKILGK